MPRQSPQGDRRAQCPPRLRGRSSQSRNLLPAARTDNARAKLCELRVRLHYVSVFVEHTIAGALTSGHLPNERKVAFPVRTSDVKFRSFSSANIQQVRSGRIINIIDAVSGVNHRENRTVAPNIEHLRERATGDE